MYSSDVSSAVVCLHFSEKVTVKKPNVTFQGQGLKATTIVWNDTANSAHGTPESASVQIDAPGFVAKNISFKV